MGTFPPIKKTLEGLIEDTRERLTIVERRPSGNRGPLQQNGQHVTDWNDAVATGFYWSETGALNSPTTNLALGFVMVKPEGANPRVMQIVYFPSATESVTRREWRRWLNLTTGVWSTWTLIDDGDSGWVNCSVRSGFAMQSGRPPQVRKIGNRIWIRWGISSTGIATASTAYDVADAPVGYRPVDGTEYFNCISSSTASTGGGGRWEINTAGVIKLTAPSSLGSYYLFESGAGWFSD